MPKEKRRNAQQRLHNFSVVDVVGHGCVNTQQKVLPRIKSWVSYVVDYGTSSFADCRSITNSLLSRKDPKNSRRRHTRGNGRFPRQSAGSVLAQTLPGQSRSGPRVHGKKGRDAADYMDKQATEKTTAISKRKTMARHLQSGRIDDQRAAYILDKIGAISEDDHWPARLETQ